MFRRKLRKGNKYSREERAIAVQIYRLKSRKGQLKKIIKDIDDKVNELKSKLNGKYNDGG